MALTKTLLLIKPGMRVRVRVVSDAGVFVGDGTLTGRRMQDAAWWVSLDEIPPAWLRRFPVEDSNRNKHVVVDRECIVEVL